MSLISASSHPHRPLFHLSSLMNRCCSAVRVNMMDWVAGRHILLLRKSEKGSSGQWTACQGALTLLCFSPSFFLISDIQEPFKPEPHPPTLYHPPPCPSEPLSTILFDWSLTCNVPLSTTGKASRGKGQNIYNKVNKASERRGREGEDQQWEGCNRTKVIRKVTQCFWGEEKKTYKRKLN